MKKKIAFRVCTNIVLVLCTILSIVAAVSSFYNAYVQYAFYTVKHGKSYLGWAIHDFTTGIVQCLSAALAVIFFVLLNFKDIKWLFGSLAEDIKAYREETAEERAKKAEEQKQRQIEELENRLKNLKGE